MNHLKYPCIVLTGQQAERVCNLSRTSLWKAVNDGKLKRVPNTCKRLFTIDAIAEFLGTTPESTLQVITQLRLLTQENPSASERAEQN